ncbi:hypothetical protein QBC39DRAFT_433326 [Podospora conica]|nr:hypothetical protein QBC39DRAFT_433326 [Schizothecium conicum]
MRVLAIGPHLGIPDLPAVTHHLSTRRSSLSGTGALLPSTVILHLSNQTSLCHLAVAAQFLASWVVAATTERETPTASREANPSPDLMEAERTDPDASRADPGIFRPDPGGSRADLEVSPTRPQGIHHLDRPFTPQSGDGEEIARLESGLSGTRRLPPTPAAEKESDKQTRPPNNFSAPASCNLGYFPSSFVETMSPESSRHTSKEPLSAGQPEAATTPSTISDYKDPSHQQGITSDYKDLPHHQGTKRKPLTTQAPTAKQPRLDTDPKMDPPTSVDPSPTTLDSSSPLSSSHTPISSPTAAATTTTTQQSITATQPPTSSPPTPSTNPHLTSSLDTRTLTISPNIVPIFWTCCQCHHQQPLHRPGPSIVESPSHSKFPLSRKPRSPPTSSEITNRDRCPSCRARHCLRCTVQNAQGHPVTTFGGRNLRPDRLTPAGWACCACGRQHWGTARYRSDKFVWMGGGLLDGGALAMVCECLTRLGVGVDDEPEATHRVCKGCVVVNRYGERLGSLDVVSFIQTRRPASCLRENLVWFNEVCKFVARERGKMVARRGGAVEGVDAVTRAAEDAEMARRIRKAAVEFGIAKGEVARVKEWIVAFWDAVDKQERIHGVDREAEAAAAAARIAMATAKRLAYAAAYAAAEKLAAAAAEKAAAEKAAAERAAIDGDVEMDDGDMEMDTADTDMDMDTADEQMDLSAEEAAAAERPAVNGDVDMDTGDEQIAAERPAVNGDVGTDSKVSNAQRAPRGPPG